MISNLSCGSDFNVQFIESDVKLVALNIFVYHCILQSPNYLGIYCTYMKETVDGGLLCCRGDCQRKLCWETGALFLWETVA